MHLGDHIQTSSEDGLTSYKVLNAHSDYVWHALVIPEGTSWLFFYQRLDSISPPLPQGFLSRQERLTNDDYYFYGNCVS